MFSPRPLPWHGTFCVSSTLYAPSAVALKRSETCQYLNDDSLPPIRHPVSRGMCVCEASSLRCPGARTQYHHLVSNNAAFIAAGSTGHAVQSVCTVSYNARDPEESCLYGGFVNDSRCAACDQFIPLLYSSRPLSLSVARCHNGNDEKARRIVGVGERFPDGEYRTPMSIFAVVTSVSCPVCFVWARKQQEGTSSPLTHVTPEIRRMPTTQLRTSLKHHGAPTTPADRHTSTSADVARNPRVQMLKQPGPRATGSMTV
ncbi:hypothetical protein B0H11DRAFT_1982658 [Mycena galericulata]|nr:hypothetical protein B0H11DRAFT_2147184 [Mycena galericulata]KAJ7504501.1 hypothetical protein B0H11DRAFT_1982658 [Mycena galericulata]